MRSTDSAGADPVPAPTTAATAATVAAVNRRRRLEVRPGRDMAGDATGPPRAPAPDVGQARSSGARRARRPGRHRERRRLSDAVVVGHPAALPLGTGTHLRVAARPGGGADGGPPVVRRDGPRPPPRRAAGRDAAEPPGRQLR